MLSDLPEEVVALAKEMVDLVRAGGARRVQQQGRRRPPVDNLERRRTEGGMEGHVVSVLCPREPVDPRRRLVASDAE